MTEPTIEDQFEGLDAFIADGGDPWSVVVTEVEWLGHTVDAAAAIRESLAQI